MSAPEAPRVPLVLLTERRNRHGARALSGWLGEARLVVVETDRTDASGAKIWQTYLLANPSQLQRTIRREAGR